MSVLVTGGTGFIGSYVVERLRDGGEPVVSYNRAPAPARPPAGVTAVQGELYDLGRLSSTITGHDVGGIVHAAGMSDPQLPAAAVAADAVGTLHLLEAGRLARFGGRIVLVSSATVYGDGAECGERAPLRPRTPFAASKAFGDLLGQAYTQSHGLDVVSLRFGDVYGPGRRLPDRLEEIVEAALARRPLRLRPADRPYRLVHVEDAARAIVAALGAPCPAGRIYDILGEPVRLEQVVAIVSDRVPHADIRIEGGRLVATDPPGPVAVSAADRELRYRPRWGLARGIDDLFAWREIEEAC
jgi:UDP-glucose 4-epimerase